MISHPPKNLKAWSTIGTSIAIASAILWTGVPLAGLTGQSKINIKELSWLVAKSQNRSEVKLVANKEVLRWLNHYVESANSRKAFRQAINRMKKHEAMIVSQLEDYKLPNDLLAVTLIESGFRNVDNGYSAGVWQFTAKTARRYGLKVNNQVDERFDIGKETTAGAEYLSRLKAGFGDWHFAFLAYNSGENRVLKAIMKTGTRDSFGVVRSRILPTETQNYLPKILAGILILKNPELVDL